MVNFDRMALRIALLCLFNSLVWAQDDLACTLQDYESHCVLDVMEEHIEASVFVNQCHIPVDVTFRVTYYHNENSSAQTWQYTFVTSNQNERVLIPGLLLPPAQALVYLFVRVPQKYFDLQEQSIVAIQASFVAVISKEEWEEVEFLNDVAGVKRHHDCTLATALPSQDYLLWIVVGSFVCFVCVIAIAGGLLWIYRRKRLSLRNLALITNVETGIPGSQPYQVMGAVQTKKTSKKVECEKNNNAQDSSQVKIEMSAVKNYLKSGFSFGKLQEEQEKELEKSVVIGNRSLVSDFAKNPNGNCVEGSKIEPTASVAKSKDAQVNVEDTCVDESPK